jgi:hypothetical protein
MGNHMIIIEAYIEAAKVPAAEGSDGAKPGTDRSLAEVLPRSSCANCKQQVHMSQSVLPSSEGATSFQGKLQYLPAESVRDQ